jgi:Transposase DDE domain
MPKEKPKNQSSEKRQQKEIDPKDIQGLKFFKVLRPFLKRLHDVGKERDRAQNRQLHMDQYCTMVLLWLYSPVVDSLRGLQQASQLKKIQKRFKLPQSSLGSLSESVRVFDPEPLKQIAAELAGHLPEPVVPQKLKGLTKTLVAVDGSVFHVLARIARLAWITNWSDRPTCGYRLHTHFEILRGLPKRIEATSANPKGEDAEQAVLERTVEPDHCYVIDRGYQKYALWNKIHAIGSNYVCRVRDGIAYETVEQRELSEEATKAGVLSDQIIRLTNEKAKLDHTVRLICVRCSPHTSRGCRSGRKYSSTGPSSDGVLRIVTDMINLPAEIIAQLYLLRWTIEIFFRMFKQLLGCRHLLSTKQNGVEIQVYSALIACMLILIYTGRTPTKRTFEMLCFYMVGWASLDEVAGHIDKLKSKSL